MTEPIVHDTKSVRMELEAGSYWWCACGRSKNQPWCDGTHRGTGITPVQLECDEAKSVSLCNCKQTKNPPYCDGTHKALREPDA